MSFSFTFNTEVPCKDQMKQLSKSGENNIKKGQTAEFFRRYNKFKKDAIDELVSARDIVFMTGYTKQFLNSYTGHNDKQCDMYGKFVKRFNKEKITDVQLFMKNDLSGCDVYFDWE